MSVAVVERFVSSGALFDFLANNSQMCARDATLSLKELHSALVPREVAGGGQKGLKRAEVDVVALESWHKRLPAEFVKDLFHGSLRARCT